MRLRATLFAAVVLAGAGVAAWKIAEAASGWYERATAVELHAALAASGEDWAEAAVDGLKVTLKGAAPDEASRFRAVEVARRIVVDGRIDDATTLRAAPPLPPPSFALELLRNEADVSLIGLVPATGGRDVIHAALGAGGLDEHVTDMLEAAGDPAPDGWQAALGFGLSVLAELPRAKISVVPGRVTVVAVADSEPDRAELQARLRRATPEGVTVALDISAPRPVIAPFAFDFTLADGRGSLAACSADTTEAAAAILTAVRAAGLADAADCPVGLGAPSPDWAVAVARGLDALRELGGGRFALRDAAAALTAPAGTTPERLGAVAARLDAALPEAFRLSAAAPPVAAETDAAPAPAAPPRFAATLAEDGTVRLSGPVRDATSRQAVLSFAAALYGHDRVSETIAIDPAIPDGWPVQVLAGVQALSELKAGSLAVTPDAVEVRGWGIDPGLDGRIEAELAGKLGKAAVVEVTFNAEAAAAALDAARPRPEICADQINGILEDGSIRFDAGSANILPESAGVIAAIADVLRGCPGADFEIGGHTDSQGSPEANRALSEVRAQAVLGALRAENLPMVRLTARGFGADDPVAGNESEAGRARNRRIEFTLVAPESVAEDVLDGEETADDAEAEADATEQCAADIGEILAGERIQFAAGAATIAPESEAAIGSIATALRGCPDARFEIGGYTDSQGSDSGNLRLSQERADAVLAALRAPDLPLAGITARGHGEADPIADNATSAGRAENRRIEFKPTAVAPVAEGDAAEQGPDAVCEARISTILAGASIEFATDAATISPESQPVIDAIGAALRGCPDVAMEIGGHTDSMGSAAGNERLSQARADAVLAALRGADLPLPGVTAHGYGASDPVADNGTAEGRARNRRIAFNLVTAEGDAGEGDGSE